MKPFVPLLMLLLCGAPSARGEVDFDKLQNDYETNLRIASRHPFREFEKAVESNDLPAVKRLLGTGIPVSLQIPQPQDKWEGIPGSEQAIHTAARRNHRDMVELLIDRGASPDARDAYGATPLSKTEDPATAHLLINRGASVSAHDMTGARPIHSAVVSGNLDLVKMLVRHGADPLSRDKHGNRPLHNAASDGTFEIASYLVGRGSSIHAVIDDPEEYYLNGWQALHFAAGREESPDAIAITTLLLRKGAAVNATTREGETPLYLAKGDSIVRLLLANGAAVNTVSRRLQEQPLHAAARDGNIAKIHLLLDHGAAPNATSYDRSTPLDEAVFFGSKDAVEVLLRRGAKPTAHTLDQARRQGDPSMIRKIRLALQAERPVRRPAHRR